MHSKNHKPLTAQERAHIARVKDLPCSVCNAPGPCDAHHINQQQHYTVIALCKSCHQDGLLGWHGQRRMWAIRKLDELGALNVTMQRLTA